jgi:hypothetical protein
MRKRVIRFLVRLQLNSRSRGRHTLEIQNWTELYLNMTSMMSIEEWKKQA